MRKILIAILILMVAGCSWTKITLPDGSSYERQGEIDYKGFTIDYTKLDGTEFKVSMDSAESSPEKLQEILDGISEILKELQGARQ